MRARDIAVPVAYTLGAYRAYRTCVRGGVD